MALLSVNYHDDVSQHINTCTQHMFLCRCNHVCLRGVFAYENIHRLALKSGIDGHQYSPQVGHSRPAITSQRLASVYVVASSD